MRRSGRAWASATMPPGTQRSFRQLTVRFKEPAGWPPGKRGNLMAQVRREGAWKPS